ncbi:cytochrome P450 (plasmid) [Rhodococcus sp. USK10]|uniref:cytochrome P450 n=1 Tax=Rhodococcus sp. USK10 TaxID=2789739 RepID=UPI001C5DDFEE|nr:cytochrome P450 [Rhodococcus sp. USK10]QYB00166.1 cytochrome P450 [Rhodococcus sp. USK10]
MVDVTSELIADPRTYADPATYHDVFAKLRADEPVRWTEPEGYRPFWTVSRYQDVVEIEKQPKLFINAPRTALRTIEQEEDIRKVTGSTQASHTLIQMDDPEHRKFRQLTQSWFMPQQLEKLHDQMDQLAGTFVDRLETYGGSCDFARDVAVWFPLRAIMLILGVPEEDEPLMLRLTQQHFAGSDPSVNGGKKVDAGSAAKEVFAYFSELTAKRRLDPRDDIVSLLADAQVDGQTISDFDRNSYYFVLALAGHDTTSSSISGLLQALMDHPEELAKLKADPTLLDSAVDEGIRWTSPVKHFFRTAVEDYDIGGSTIKAGDSVMVCYPSANFDDAAFDDPHSFRVDRKPNRHIAFGFGIHQCLGQHMAKMEMRSLFGQIVERLDWIESAGDPQWLEANFVGGLKSLPIRYQMKTLLTS